MTGFHISYITQLKRMLTTLETQVDSILTNFKNMCPISKSTKTKVMMKLWNGKMCSLRCRAMGVCCKEGSQGDQLE